MSTLVTRPRNRHPDVRRAARRRAALLAALAGLLAALAMGCSGDDDDDPDTGPGDGRIRVASFDFPESRILAEIFAQALERERLPVTRLAGLGPREVVQPALQQGLVDVVPEYAGSALAFLGGTARAGDIAETSERLRSALAPRGVDVLPAAAAEDQNGVVVTTATARAKGLRRISDLGQLAPSLRFAGPPECPVRPYCLQGLQDRYGLQFGRFVPLTTRDAIAEALLSLEADVGMLETTSPQLGDGRLRLLSDDRRLQPAENVVPVIRRAALERYGAPLARALNAVTSRLTTADVVQLNRRVILAGDPIPTVARAWLERHRP